MFCISMSCSGTTAVPAKLLLVLYSKILSLDMPRKVSLKFRLLAFAFARCCPFFCIWILCEPEVELNRMLFLDACTLDVLPVLAPVPFDGRVIGPVVFTEMAPFDMAPPETAEMPETRCAYYCVPPSW